MKEVFIALLAPFIVCLIFVILGILLPYGINIFCFIVCGFLFLFYLRIIFANILRLRNKGKTKFKYSKQKNKHRLICKHCSSLVKSNQKTCPNCNSPDLYDPLLEEWQTKK